MANGLRSTCWVRSSVRRGGPLLWSTNRVGPSKRLAASGPDSARIRDTVRLTMSGEQSKKGGILNALRRSPLVGADLDLNRPLTPGRRVDL